MKTNSSLVSYEIQKLLSKDRIRTNILRKSEQKVLATCINRYYLLLNIIGFIINWFGDSLDGRLAIYRNKSRKHYGFSLDLTVDWLTTVVVGLGFIIYN